MESPSGCYFEHFAGNDKSLAECEFLGSRMELLTICIWVVCIAIPGLGPWILGCEPAEWSDYCSVYEWFARVLSGW